VVRSQLTRPQIPEIIPPRYNWAMRLPPGYDMKVVKAGHVLTLKDILGEPQRASAETPK